MNNIQFIIYIIFLALLVHSCGSGRIKEKSSSINDKGLNQEADDACRQDPKTISETEVMDTSFVLPRSILDNPMAFMKAITDVQMIGCVWTDVCHYPEKLHYGDSILRNISSALANSGGVPVYLVEELCCAEIATYTVSIRKKGESSYTVYDDKSMYQYDVTDRRVHCEHENIWPISRSFRELVEKWDKEKLLFIGATNDDEIESWDGCITRLTLDMDSIYVDMIKLSLLNFTIMDSVDDWDNQH